MDFNMTDICDSGFSLDMIIGILDIHLMHLQRS